MQKKEQKRVVLRKIDFDFKSLASAYFATAANKMLVEKYTAYIL